MFFDDSFSEVTSIPSLSIPPILKASTRIINDDFTSRFESKRSKFYDHFSNERLLIVFTKPLYFTFSSRQIVHLKKDYNILILLIFMTQNTTMLIIRLIY